jgi:hypothetical protein
MPYTSVQDVRDLAPHVPINANSVPSEGAVLRWIAELEGTLNEEITASGFTTPLVNPINVAWAKQIVAHRAMARVMRSRPNPETDPENFQRWADAQIKRLREPKDAFTLRGEVVIDGVVKESSLRVSSNLRDLLDEGQHATRDMIF